MCDAHAYGDGFCNSIALRKYLSRRAHLYEKWASDGDLKLMVSDRELEQIWNDSHIYNNLSKATRIEIMEEVRERNRVARKRTIKTVIHIATVVAWFVIVASITAFIKINGGL